MDQETEQTDSILIVDDDIDLIKLLETYLLKKKYRTETVMNGALALEAVQNNKYDLILLDIQMPDMDGFEVCERMKLLPQMKDVPILFLSGLSETKNIVKGFKLGAADYIKKPFYPSELLARIKINLELKSAREIINKNNVELTESNNKLKQKNEELQKALNEVKILKGLLPVCASCKKIRQDNSDPNEQNSWLNMEEYISDRSDAKFSHGLCPECQVELYPDIFKRK